mmetsp:Transcript_61414/g.150316  ORF Transcript_61414/g.150316 Transcript_61414/m.150316 type:complete len:83 (+) Transcript_61414:3570-3818(+)
MLTSTTKIRRRQRLRRRAVDVLDLVATNVLLGAAYETCYRLPSSSLTVIDWWRLYFIYFLPNTIQTQADHRERVIVKWWLWW